MLSVSFVMEGTVTTLVRVRGNLDGTLSFELTRQDGGSIADLEAVFFDLNRRLDGAGFQVFGDAGLTLGACVASGVDTLGRDATVKQAMVDTLGDFDVGITFGPHRGLRGAPDTTGFTLSHAAVPLTLDLIDMVDFGLRYAWSASGVVDTTAAQPAGTGAHQGAVHDAGALDVLEVVDAHAVRARPLADDARGGVLAVIDLQGARYTGAAVGGRAGRRAGAGRVGVVGGPVSGEVTDATDSWGKSVESRVCPWPSYAWAGLRPLP